MRPTLLATLAALALLLPLPARAESLTLAPTPVTDWKAVYGRIEARDRIPARARLGGTLVRLTVAEGDTVEAGQPIGEVVDEKIAFQLSAIDAQLEAARSQLANAEVELRRGEDLLARGVTTAQRLDALRTQVDVVSGQIASAEAQRRVVEQQAAEGTVLAPIAGRVLDVPAAVGAVVMPGEAVATVGGGGIFLRLAVPERHATDLAEGDSIEIEGPDGPRQGRLAQVYPLIENGRVLADVEVEGLPERFVDARVLVRLPVGSREAFLVPQTALLTRAGVDFVAVEAAGSIALRAVVPGQRHVLDGAPMVEILTGLSAGDVVVTDHE